LAVVDDVVAEGGPEGEGLGIVVKDGEAYGGSAGLAEAVLDEGRQLPSVSLLLLRGVDHQQADPGVFVVRVGMRPEGDRDPDEPPGTAREQYLRVRVGQFVGQRGRHLLGPDVLRVREVTAQGVERVVGGVEGGQLGEQFAGECAGLGRRERFEEHGGTLAAGGSAELEPDLFGGGAVCGGAAPDAPVPGEAGEQEQAATVLVVRVAGFLVGTAASRASS
jgi:hypothetical protein